MEDSDEDMNYRAKAEGYTEEYQTPLYIYNYLNKYFNFELDPCTIKENPLKTKHYYTKEIDGLYLNWGPFNAFVNPPYGNGNEEAWIHKAMSAFDAHGKNIFLLLPAKTEAKWFVEIFEASNIIIFPQKRISFIRDGKKQNGNNIGSAIFGLSKDDGAMMNFYIENVVNGVRSVMLSNKFFFFPDRDVLEKIYSTNSDPQKTHQ